LIEEVTPETIKTWKRGKKFRKYDTNSEVPILYGGKKHFVNKTIEKGKRIWLDMGFKEMKSTFVQTSFWNFDALFTAQDHPVRDLHDTFFIKGFDGQLPENKIVNRVKQAHEKGVAGSKGWQYSWSEKESKKVVLRTHTTCLSAKTLASIDVKKDLPTKFFAIGKCFRNETLDWSHGFEFNQTEGIVVDKNANFRNLLGYLKEFAKKMGFTKIRIQPAYFPYTEPSVEGAVWHEEKKEWVEVLAAGIFRPEVTEPLLGEPVPVLAWGPGFDRLMLFAYNMSDIRKIYENDIKDLRQKKVLIR
jgi:phenylalanyl-tRNA synthetase alpha chain